jgi:hypothetical protein
MVTRLRGFIDNVRGMHSGLFDPIRNNIKISIISISAVENNVSTRDISPQSVETKSSTMAKRYFVIFYSR